MLSLQVTYDQVIIVSTAKTSIKNGRKSSTNSQLQIQFKFSQRDLKLKLKYNYYQLILSVDVLHCTL